ncbi:MULTISPECIES: diguanylate cyclase [unclassified Leptolyngbya]|uniref:diguanylate cyclase domain-containing protein n=1 Tax=unclassified Leptolyngbya TaxID=2650499 RepID=UPI001684FA0E|nr:MULTISPECIES: diguanylate cyclase [unclassified Leptolyngbya]MBD1913487.1 diguanylate cyclase [Leptolyngbya sp. FACHB-8]MBD2154887.1 diguanylate cyclase [Leptolyngbya sp. FACHB-16]
MKNLQRILLQYITYTVPLQTVLVVPFLVQVMGIVGLVAYVSYRNDQQAVQALAYALTNEVAERVSDRLNTYLQAPHQFLTMSRVDLEQGSLSPDDLDGFERRFYRQLQELDWLRSVHFTNTQGKYIGLFQRVNRLERSPGSSTLSQDSQVVARMDTPAPGTLQEHVIDASGHPARRIYRQDQWDPRTQPWYRTAMEGYAAGWTPIYSGLGASMSSLTAVTPVYKGNRLAGVLGVDLEVEQISSFLKGLNFSSSGQVFLMERSGSLIATSTQEATFVPPSEGNRTSLMAAIDSPDPVIHGATRHLVQQWGNLNRIQKPQTFTFASDRAASSGPMLDRRYFAQAFPYRDRYGLDWLVVVVIPAHDLTGGLYENIRQTVIWTGFALLGAIALGVCTTRWIMQPILGLRDSANRMAQGEFDLNVPSTPILELRQLAFSFREMANQVQLSLYEMQALNADLNESRANLEKFLDSIPVGVIVHNADGAVAYLNRAAKGVLGLASAMDPSAETFGMVSQNIVYDLYRTSSQQLYPPQSLPAVRALKGEQVVEEDVEIHWKGGGRIQVEVLATPILSKDGRISHAIVALQDITTRKEAARVLASYNRRLEEQVQRRTLALEQQIQERQQIAATLHQRETTLRAILSAIPDLLVRLKSDGTYIERLSDGEVRVLKTDSMMQGQKLHEYLPVAIAESRLRLIQRAIATGTVQIDEYQIEVVNDRRDEEVRIVKTAEDEVLIIVRDISDRKRMERALQQSEAHNRAILTAIPDLMFRTRRDGTYLGYVKTNALTDLLPEDFDPIGRNLSESLPPDVAKRHLHYITQALDTGQLQVYEQEHCIEGGVQYEEVRIMPCGPDEVLFLIRDIGDRKRIEQELRCANLRLEQLAQTDGLTQVANRRHFDSRLQQEWQTLSQEKEPLSLILFDVDYFKFYNDEYGHQAGDLCLIKIAAAAGQIIRHPTDLVARYGGEEFAIILPRTDVPGAIRVAERLRDAIQHLAIPHAQSKVSASITVSIGISALVPSPQTSPDNLLTQADQALYLAKQQGRDRAIEFPRWGDRNYLSQPNF